MSQINNIIEQINDNSRATLDIPMTNGDTQRIDCILKKTDPPPSFKIIYSPNTFLADNLKYGSKCRLDVKHRGNARVFFESW
jgi:hypothetical protein